MSSITGNYTCVVPKKRGKIMSSIDILNFDGGGGGARKVTNHEN